MKITKEQLSETVGHFYWNYSDKFFIDEDFILKD